MILLILFLYLPLPFLKNSNVVSLHARLTTDSKHILSAENMKLLPEGAVIVNSARGGLMDYKPLPKLLRSGRIGALALDVYDIEPLPENHKLRFLPNALLLPHLGYVTKENYEVFYSQMFENLEAFKEGKPIRVIQMLN